LMFEKCREMVFLPLCSVLQLDGYTICKTEGIGKMERCQLRLTGQTAVISQFH